MSDNVLRSPFVMWLRDRIAVLDPALLAIVGALALVGLVTLYSAAADFPWRLTDQLRNFAVAAAVMFVRMMNMMNGTANPDPLEFNNVEAELYGFDMDWRYDLTERWSLHGVVNYVRGKRKDVDESSVTVQVASPPPPPGEFCDT